MNLAILSWARCALILFLSYLWIFYDMDGPGKVLTVYAMLRVIFGLPLFWVRPLRKDDDLAYHVDVLALIFAVSWAGSLVLAILLGVTYILRLAALIFYKETQS
ncbi:hypothetical protein FBF48_10675 [Streptococcus salivarius]|uniref:YggT family protein n=1 Tax=Streptococcus salivarius TaxID=1304 RepID=A0AAX2V095_STRSL|nr:hypothetical protein [Streptococcus salivarius]TNF65035.1 hypothetical protein FBF48_10675 [Streptococcus salivarius]